MIAVYHQDDKDSGDAPKERFAYRAAGPHSGVADGRGGSSYIDDTILRDRDHNTAWTTASDGTLERRDFYCQNWRADVIALVNSSAAIQEHVRYGLAGEPFLISPADVTYSATNPSSGLGVPSGLVNSEDFFRYGAMYAGPIADPRTDFNHDGTVNSDDYFAYLAKYSADAAKAWGPGVLSNVDNRKGYAGYENDRAVEKLWHVRFRVLDAETGRWLKRDPIGFVDGPALYGYVLGRALATLDPTGLACTTTGCSSGTGSSGVIVKVPMPIPGVTAPRFNNTTPPAGLHPLLVPCWNGAVSRKLREVYKTCGSKLLIYWGTDTGGLRGSTSPDRLWPCEVYVDITPGDCSAILHELQHVIDLCRYYGLCSGRWMGYQTPVGLNLICHELRGYCAESDCRSQRARMAQCPRVCGSVSPPNPGLWGVPPEWLEIDGHVEYDRCIANCRRAVLNGWCRGARWNGPHTTWNDIPYHPSESPRPGRRPH